MKNIIALFAVLQILFMNFHIAYASALDNVSDFAYMAGDSNITLSWINPSSPDMAGVLIARSISSISWAPVDGTVYNFGSDVGGDISIIYYSTGEEYTDSPLTNGVDYYFKSFTFDYDAIYSSGSEELIATPAPDDIAPEAPSNFTGSVSGENLNLNWSEDTSGDVQRYKVSCLPDKYTLPELSVEIYGNNATLTTTITNVEYTCSVQAVDYSNNYSVNSNSIKLVSTANSDGNIYPPQELRGEMINRDAQLNWEQNNTKNAIGFNVYIKCSDETLYNKINNQTVLPTNYTVSNLYYDYTCNLYVTSIDENLNESAASNIIILETGSRENNHIKTSIITGNGQANIRWSYSDSSNANGNNGDDNDDSNNGRRQ